MKQRTSDISSYIVIFICLAICQPVQGCSKSGDNKDKAAESSAGANSTAPYNPESPQFTNSDLDQLLAPIALYPDPLIAQILPAATFIDQLDEANRVLGGKSDDNLIANQSWDVAVKSVAHYPQVLQMMVQKQDWTIALGQAYVNQSTDVMKAIQRLRAEAKSSGALVTNSQQKIVQDGSNIQIWPAQPQVIYVPQYNPEVVYVQQQPSGPSTGDMIAASLISFGAGLAIGSWLNNDCYWNTWGIGYHGWVGGGWVGYSRNYVHINNIYVNDRYRNINVNRNIVNRNIDNYRRTVRTDGVNRDTRVRNVNQPRDWSSNHGTFNDSRPAPLQNRDNHQGFDKQKALNEAGGIKGGDHDHNKNQPDRNVSRPDNHPVNRDRSNASSNNRSHDLSGGGATDRTNRIDNRPVTRDSNSAFSGAHDGGFANRQSDRGFQSIGSQSGNIGGHIGDAHPSSAIRPSGAARPSGGGRSIGRGRR